MGPDFGGSRSVDLPKRPKFSWDIKNVPWTDGKGDKEEYASSVELWCAFHDMLPASNSNKIPAALRGTMLQSHLYGRAKDLCKNVPDSVIRSDAGVNGIVKALHKRDPLSAVSTVYQDFLALLSTKRGSSESFRNFESRFAARVSKFNAHAKSCVLPEALTAFMLLANSAIDSTQRVSVLAAASLKDDSLSDSPTTDDYLKAMQYDIVASVLRQCDKGNENVSHYTPQPISASASVASSSSGRPPKHKRTLTPEQLADFKMKTICRSCGKKGHWKSDHNKDGTLKPGVTSLSVDGDTGSKLKRTVTFNMAKLTNTDHRLACDFTGPLLDDGAPYCGLGSAELELLKPVMLQDWNGVLDPLSDKIANRPFWQYGVGQHASAMKKIIGSVLISATTDEGVEVNMRHLVMDGSSQWVIGRNVTKHCNIVHVGGNYLSLPDGYKISLVDHDMHSYVPYNSFLDTAKARETASQMKFFCATAMVSDSESRRPWVELRKVIDKVHKHVCGHSSYSDIKVLLQRNNMWSNEVKKYLIRVIDSCSKCAYTSDPKPSRKVSLSSLNRSFNKLVCIDHLHLGDMRVCHVMDATSRYSVGAVVPDTSMISAIEVLDAHWISTFWTPESLQYDQAFENDIFNKYLSMYGISSRPIPARRHNKNVLESKHKVIRDVFLRLSACADEAEHGPLLVQQALRISNDLYGNDVLSSHELAKGCTRPVEAGCFPITLPDEIVNAHEKLIAKRKLTKILRSKTIEDIPISPGDLVQVFIKLEHEKRGKWSSPKPVLGFDKTSGIVTVPGSSGRVIKAAIEDVRPAVVEDELAIKIQEAIDQLSLVVEETIDDFAQDNIYVEQPDETDDGEDPVDFDSDENVMMPLPQPDVGQPVEIYWPLDDKFYPGTIASADDSTGAHVIKYDDGDEETLFMNSENWRFSDENSLKANATELSSHSKMALQQYFEIFGHKEFLGYRVEGLPSYPMSIAYATEESRFLEAVREVSVSDVPKNANVITSHVIYKVKANDDRSLKLKARIAPHGNKYKDRSELKSDSATCPPTGIRMLLSIASIYKWPLCKIGFTSAFLQTGDAQRDVYVVPPKECGDRSKYWLLLTAAYGLVNAGAKWKDQSDSLFRSLGFSQLVFVPQLFYVKESGSIKTVAVKIVDDVLFAGPSVDVKNIVSKIKQHYELNTIVHGPASFLFFGLQLIQDDEMEITIHGDEKLDALQTFPIDRNRRKQIDEPLNKVELRSFRSVNSSCGWLGIAASPFCALYASYLQQKAPNPTVRDLITQINSLRLLKKLGSVVRYKRPSKKGDFSLSLLVFADASRTNDYGQLCYIAGLLFGSLTSSSTFHVLSWSSHKSKRPVKSIGSAETLAAGEAIDEGKLLSKSFAFLLGVEVPLWVVVDSKDLFTTLSTFRNATDRSIRGDVSVIRCDFETRAVSRMIWVDGKTSLADCGTKPNSPLDKALQLMLVSGEIPFDFPKSEVRSSEQFLG